MAAIAGEPLVHRFSQRATFLNVVPLAIKNAVLVLLTLTLYRFWARTDVRRRLWATTRVMDDPLEYTGSGGELFRGFLLAILFFFLPTIVILYIGPLLFDRTLATLLILAFYLLTTPLIAIARYLMRRYQLSRTRWRGIRFSLDGSAVTYAIASTGWTMLEFITLGWYAPAARMRRAKLLWESTRFGDQPFEFEFGEAKLARGLYWPFLLAWLGGPAAYIAGSITFVKVGETIQYYAFWYPVPYELMLAGAAASGLLVFAVLFVILSAPFNAAAMNRIAALLILDGARFRLRARSLGLAFVQLASGALFILSLGALAPVAGMLQVRYVFNRLEMIGTPRFADIAQNPAPVARSGEGLADAFDLDFGVGVI